MRKSNRKSSFNKRIWAAIDNVRDGLIGDILFGREEAERGNHFGGDGAITAALKEVGKVEEYLDYLAETDASATARDYVRAYRCLQRLYTLEKYKSWYLEEVYSRI